MPLAIDELFFPVIDVRANPKHDPNGERRGTQIETSFACNLLDPEKGKYAASFVLASDEAASVNPPYSFRLEVYAALTCEEAVAKHENRERIVKMLARRLLIGSARNQLAALTSQAPWGKFILGFELSGKDGTDSKSNDEAGGGQQPEVDIKRDCD